MPARAHVSQRGSRLERGLGLGDHSPQELLAMSLVDSMIVLATRRLQL